MTNFKKWVKDSGFNINKQAVICFNSDGCNNCPIYKKFRVCDSDDGTIEKEIEEWLESEAEE